MYSFVGGRDFAEETELEACAAEKLLQVWVGRLLDHLGASFAFISIGLHESAV
jgi:hypothetical protein